MLLGEEAVGPESLPAHPVDQRRSPHHLSAQGCWALLLVPLPLSPPLRSRYSGQF